jgi:hypothetical protein
MTCTFVNCTVTNGWVQSNGNWSLLTFTNCVTNVLSQRWRAGDDWYKMGPVLAGPGETGKTFTVGSGTNDFCKGIGERWDSTNQVWLDPEDLVSCDPSDTGSRLCEAEHGTPSTPCLTCTGAVQRIRRPLRRKAR